MTDEFEVERPNGRFARSDLVVLVNGIPLVVIECKKSSVDVMEGVTQNIRNWGEDYIPHLFRYAQLVMAMNPDKVLYGTCGTPAKYFVSWHEDNKDWLNDWCRKCSPDGQIREQDRALVSLLHPERLLDLIRNFIIYDNNVKKICRYKQYFAVKKCMDRILLRDNAHTRNGVVWHTQGSGKTITMIMLTKMITRESMKPESQIREPRFIMVTDRVNLDKQIRDNFIHTQMSPHRAKTGKGLIELLQDNSNTVITALVNKFEAAVKQEYCNDSKNLFLFIDEGHRTQYGKLNLYMNKVLPNAVKIAFTGTPLIQKQPKDTSRKIVPAKDTYAKFGPLIDKYTLQDAIDDKVTVPIVYEGRVIPQEVTSQQINEHLKHITVGLTEDARKDLEVKYSRFVTLAQTEQRLNMIAFDLHEHFVHYVRPKGFKAMLTCSSRAEAVQLFYKLRGLVGITPGAGFVPMWAAVIIGLTTSPVCYIMISYGKKKFGFDDALDAFSCHGTGGIWGGLLTGVFSCTAINSSAGNGLVYGEFAQFGAQAAGIGITIVIAVVGTLICYGITRLLTGKIRVDLRDELMGLDVSQHGESAYPSFNGLDN